MPRRDAGVHVAIATGRTPAGALHVARNLKLRGPGVCTDGAMVVDMDSGEVLVHRTLGGAPTASIAEALGLFPHVTATVLLGSTVLLDGRGSMLERVARSWSPVLEEVPNLLDHACWASDDGVTAGAIIGLDEQIRSIVEQLSEQPLQLNHFEVTQYPGISSLIFHAEGVSKASGLATVAEHHGLTVCDTVTVGDWLNDIPMLEAAPISFAMGHAPDRVKTAAKHVLEADGLTGGAIAELADRVWPIGTTKR